MTDAPPSEVTADEKLLLVLYRLNQAQRELEYKRPRRLLGFSLRPRYGLGWASAHHALQKAKAALGVGLAVDQALLDRKPEVKEIERRLYRSTGP